MQAPARVVTFLFTDIEGSTRLWEEQPARMQPALARHDAIARAAVKQHHGSVVKMSGDGLHAAFEDPLDALAATLELQLALIDPEHTAGIALRVRCGLHAGVDERRDNDFFGPSVNRAARIMSAAHGGQVLVSQTVAVLVKDRLPEGVTLRDLGAARLRDLERPEHLFQVAHAQLRSEFPPLRSLEATPNNLPQQLTSFIGRERELGEATNLLTKTRLLTLVGTGGIGKTRLSLQLAAEAMVDFPDGVWFVELAPLTEGERVAQAVASALGVKEEPGEAVIDALLRHLKNRRLLIVLDNCEHLTSACAELARHMLEAAPQLKLVASTREHLRTAGEYTYVVPPLSLPHDNEVGHSLTQFGAVKLFAERAAAAQPTFEVSSENEASVLEICRRLDGIPLAIELAAARVRTLSVGAIAERLNDRFRLLASGDRAVLPRQQTLRALIDWSYDLLSDPERIVLRRLAVFAGGWTLEAAETVASGEDLPECEVFDLLAHLVEKSLVIVDATRERYRLLDTIRQYAEERLGQEGETDAVHNRHLAFYLAFAEKARPELSGPRQAAWLTILDAERENLLAAHSWCGAAAGRGDADLRLVHAIKLYWIHRGLLNTGHSITLEALGRLSVRKPGILRCRTLFDVGQLCYFMGRYREAQSYLGESLSLARELGDKVMLAMIQQPLGLSWQATGDTSAAKKYLEEALSLAREMGHKRETAAAMNALAQLHRTEGRLGISEPLYEEAVVLMRELDDRESIAVGLLNLAMVSVAQGKYIRARALLLEALGIAEEVGSKPTGQSVLEVSAGLAASVEDWENAAWFYGAAEGQMEKTGLRREPADEAFLAPLIARTSAVIGAHPFAAAAVTGRGASYTEAMKKTRHWLAGDS
ncbi:MAG TPA: tetratricopeptide repeat protein [Casimicrobiaceae bacterium]|nr:tetratricopeptide repeat protein [Casimicrobiaceae bacterium]